MLTWVRRLALLLPIVLITLLLLWATVRPEASIDVEPVPYGGIVGPPGERDASLVVVERPQWWGLRTKRVLLCIAEPGEPGEDEVQMDLLFRGRDGERLVARTPKVTPAGPICFEYDIGGYDSGAKFELRVIIRPNSGDIDAYCIDCSTTVFGGR